MRCWLLLLLLLLLCPGSRDALADSASATALPLVLTERFEPIRSLKELDAPVRAALRADDPDARLADPGEPFSRGCTPARGEAMRRLVLAGKSGSLRFVEYESGGIAYSFSLLVFRMEDGHARLLARAQGPPHPPDFESLRAAVRAGKLRVLTP